MKNWLEKYLPITFDTKLFLFLVLGFIVATVVGTMSFIIGYYTVAVLQGHSAEIFYRGVGVTDDLPRSLLIPIAGILTPVLIGFVGLFVLFLSQKYFNDTNLTFIQWLFVFMSLFLLRQLDNISFGILKYIFIGNFSPCSADVYVSQKFNLPFLSIDIFMSLFGLIILFFVLFRFIPKTQRLTFLVSGIIGGPLGYYLWFFEFGKKFLP